MNTRLRTVLAVLAALTILVLLVALVDGGREDLRQITQPVAVPEALA